MQVKPVGWFEIYVDDMQRARAFYEGVFGVTLENLPSPDLGEMWAFGGAMDESNGASGALVKMEGFGPGAGGTIVYFICADAAEEAGRAATLGGTVVQEKMSIGDYGFVALVSDTEGNVIGLHSMT
jgi:uncharacterized protein